MKAREEAEAKIAELAEILRSRRTEGGMSGPPNGRSDRARLLVDELRRLIDGAVETSPMSVPMSVPATTPEAAIIRPDGTRSRAPLQIGEVAEEITALTPRDEAKLRAVDLSQRAASHYTPSTAPHYLESYYEAELRPASVEEGDRPITAVTPDGALSSLTSEERILLGLAEDELTTPRPMRESDRRDAMAGPEGRSPAQSRGSAEARSLEKGPKTSPNSSRPPEPEERSGPITGVEGPDRIPVMVHFLDGGTRRGRVDGFEPSTGRIDLFLDGSLGTAERIDLRAVLAVFLGLRRGQPATPEGGQGVVVQLINDRAVRGTTDDYRPGAASMTVVPIPRRQGVDRLWIPAWSVRAIELE